MNASSPFIPLAVILFGVFAGGCSDHVAPLTNELAVEIRFREVREKIHLPAAPEERVVVRRESRRIAWQGSGD